MAIVQELSERILQFVEKKPIYQNELVYLLNVKHDQRVSEALKILLNEHKVSRKRVGLTYLISLNGSGSHPKHNFNALLRDDVFSPCCGCRSDECIPSMCTKIVEWTDQ